MSDWDDTPPNDDGGFMGGESYPALKFAAVGDTHEGVVRGVKKKQDVSMATNTPITWPNGDPKWVWLFELEQADGEMGTLWVRGNMVKAIREAVTAAGAGSPIGWQLKIQHHALGEPVAGKNPAKLYRAKITPAPARVGGPGGGGSGGAAVPPEEPF
jgi:predicted RNA-binding protein YlqC (UPF0109 family)